MDERLDPRANENKSGEGRPLPDREAAELTEHIARLTQSGVSLSQGLRAAATEARHPKLASTLRFVADQIDQGRPLEEILTGSASRLPAHMRRLLSAAIRSGRVNQVLLELMDFYHFRRDLKRCVSTALAYPLILLLMVTGLTVLVFTWVVPQFAEIFEEFEVQLPLSTQFLFWISDTLGPIILLSFAFVAGSSVVLRLALGRASWQWYLWGMPIFGPLLQWSGTCQFTRLLRMLIQQGIPLPDALRLSSDGVHDANVASTARRLADDVDRGRTLHDALIDTPRLPTSLIPVVGWGEKTDNLAEALRAASEMFAGRLRLRTLWLTSVLPPLTFIFVGVLVAVVLAGVFQPLAVMIQYLTTWTFTAAASQNGYEAAGTGLFSLVVLGAVLLAALRLAYVRRRDMGDDALVLVLTVAGWGLVLVGLLGTMCYMAFPFGFVFALVTLVIVSMVVAKYRNSERRSLLWVLAVSAERGLPLAPAARAFAAEHGDEQGRRAMRLAELLEAGVALPRALDRSGNRLPTDAQLAIRLGCQTHHMGRLLKQVAHDRQQINPVWQPLYEKSLYFLLLVGVAGVCLAFVTIRVVPTYASIFDDFGASMPVMTRMTFAWSGYVLKLGILAIPFYAVLICVCGIGVFYYMGWMRWEPPLLRWFTRRVHSANIMRALSFTLEQDIPVADSVGLLSRCYPKAHVRSRLATAEQRIRQGTDWCDTLRALGLIMASDAAVLRSAQRVGNLPWALREMADSSIRRLAYRLSALHQVAYPIAVLAFALPVAWYAVALIYPLAQLIENLAHV